VDHADRGAPRRGTWRQRGHIKARLLGAGLKEDRCERCGINEWRGEPLSVQLHHIDGDGRDNRLENLGLLCPNCHSQTATYGGRNGHRRNGGPQADQRWAYDNFPACYLDPAMWGRCAFLPLAGVLMVAALGAAGCGGSDSAPVVTVQGASGASGAGGAATLTKSEFIDQANSICNEANAAISSLNSGTVSTNSKVQATQELQITQSELNSLESLNPPNQDSSTLKGYLSALRDEVTALMHKRDATEQGGDTSAADVEAASASSNAQTAARSYGLKDCAKGGPTSTTSTGTGTTPTTTIPTPTTPTTVAPTTPTPAPPAPVAPPSGGTGGAASGGGGGGTGGGTSGGGTGGTGGSGGVSP
jgi:HNH endonuclease